jgi:hypothetical protein
MTVSVEDIGKYLGKTIEDAMGRPAGKLVGLTADIKDEVQAVQIAQGNGEVSQHPINLVRVIDGRPVLLQTWRVEAEDLRKEHDIVKRRSQALDLLFKDGDIDQHEYNQLRSSYEDLAKQIKNKREQLIDTLKREETKVEQQISDLQTALTNNKMLFTAMEIDEQTYQAVTESIRAGLEIARKERHDVENTREILHSIDSLETETSVTRAPAPTASAPTVSPTKVPDVVVIKMREPTQS